MRGETLEQVTARANASAYIPPPEPTANAAGRRKGIHMATKVKLKKGEAFTFPATRAGGTSFAAKYPWDEWFNGDLLLLERSEGPENDKGTVIEGTETVRRDYNVPQDAMFPKTKTAARNRYKIVQMTKRDAEGRKLPSGGIILQAQDMTPEERLAEDQLRAEEKAAKKAAEATSNSTVSTVAMSA